MRAEDWNPDPGAGDSEQPWPDVGVGQTVTELRPGMSGRWLVTTQGSTHVWELDQMTYERRPGPESRSGAFEYDGTPHPVTKVVWWPRVGGRAFVFFDDPTVPWLLEQYRISSMVVEIRRLPDDPDPSTPTHGDP